MGSARRSFARSLAQEISSGAVPGAGREVVCPSNRFWDLKAVTAVFTATATVGSRRLALQLRDSSNAICGQWLANWEITASQVVSANFGAGDPTNAIVGTTLLSGSVAFQGVHMGPGDKLRLLDDNGIDVTDTAVFILYIERELES